MKKVLTVELVETTTTQRFYKLNHKLTKGISCKVR